MYDYIIVGGGAAGCTLAHRLTEDPSVEVLLLESGNPEENRTAVKDPTRVWDLLGSDIDWGFETEPQPGLNGRSIAWPRGKALGGSTVINGMAYVRGHAYDFDNWADLGNDGWGYDDLLPYFKRSENLTAEGDAEYHGTDGPLTVSRGEEPNDLDQTLIEAAEEVGFERNTDFNGERQTGVGLYHSTIADGHRHSTAAAFIKPILDRDNLHIETGAHVTELTFSGDTATGVVYNKGWTSDQAAIAEDGEVVLSAGAIQSPQLLMLSGIGPADHLEEHDIDVKVDLPGVGRNLQDHLRVDVAFETTEEVESVTDKAGRGSRYDRVSVGAFKRSDPDPPAPDMQFGMAPGLSPQNPGSGYAITVLPLRPTSRGRLTLTSDDPFDHPKIDPNYLSTEKDVDDFVTCVRWARKIGEADALADIRDEEHRPGPDAESDEAIAEYIRNHAVTGYHATCTAKMGDDEMAVVDDDLRVHGLNSLRVIDASVMPQITSGNTNAPTIAIAEKGADLLKEAQ
ncbi:GMC family oxidoreductase [Halobellus rubicundus]|uniref:GMC family oxidoreductase n=1 Tax=Halobellus rubicundus TaxID=2996466 RepID=A0ABD5MFB1_9EURY